MEDLTLKETLTQPQNAWLFDVDGVITNPLEKSITEPDMIPEIIKRLQANEPVSIVSGRALPWLLDRVVSKIEERVGDKKLLENLFVSAEFGGVSIRYQNGEQIKIVDETVGLPQDLMDSISSLVIKDCGDVAFVDPEKVTHFTAEMKGGVSIDEFRLRQHELSARLREIVETSSQAGELEVNNDRIATNVKNKRLNKHLAIQKVLEWLKNRRVNPQTFHVFGDSRSDLEMGHELHMQGKSLRFIYVGEEDLGEMPFEVIRPSEHVDRGTIEYLQAN